MLLNKHNKQYKQTIFTTPLENKKFQLKNHKNSHKKQKIVVSQGQGAEYLQTAFESNKL